jgi:hypothetical protein
MAGKRRSGGLRPPELRGTLGTLFRSAIEQASGVRDALERGAREGRTRIDSFRADRQRHDALAELGELVLDLIRRGEIDLDELPEARDLVHHLDELDAGADDDEPAPRALRRERFDARPPRTASRDDDGTVGSGARWSPPRPAAPQRVWRPPVDDEPAASAAPPPTHHRPVPLPKDPHRKGGISFDDEEDLGEYMHPDDVPPKDRSGGDS